MNALVYVDIDRAFIKVFSELRSDVIYGWPLTKISLTLKSYSMSDTTELLYVINTAMIHISVPYSQLTLLFFIMGQKMKKPSRQGREVSEG